MLFLQNNSKGAGAVEFTNKSVIEYNIRKHKRKTIRGKQYDKISGNTDDGRGGKRKTRQSGRSACALEGLFEGEMKACGDKITYYMLNGQTFAISVAEIH